MKQTILRFPAIRKRTGLSRTTVWRLERTGLFPQRIRIGLRGVGWFETEIDEFVADRERVQLGGSEQR